MIQTAHIVPTEAHKQNLIRLCRIHGRLQSRVHHVTYNCFAYAERLEMAFKVQMSHDLEDIHPRNLWNECNG